MSTKPQARPPKTIALTPGDFGDISGTAVHWLGIAGVMVNSHGTVILVDPLLSAVPDSIFPEHGMLSEANGNRLLIDLPVHAHSVPKVDAVLYTHSDDDHLGFITAPMLKSTGCAYHCTAETADKLLPQGVPPARVHRHKPGETFSVGKVKVEMTPASHPWQASLPDIYKGWHYQPEDCTGYKFHTQDGVIWIPGDTLPLDEHRRYTDVDLMFADFSDDPFHYGSENMVALVNALSQAELIPFHWGTLDMPDFPPQNADPARFRDGITRPERLHILAAGERFTLRPASR